MGQHMASLVVLPEEWTSTMRPLQDQCEPTPYDAVQKLFRTDMSLSIEDVFDEFNPNPIGVASLAQVHVGKHKESGKYVAVKVGPPIGLLFSLPFNISQVQHPHLAEFCDVDMKMVEVTLGSSGDWIFAEMLVQDPV